MAISLLFPKFQREPFYFDVAMLNIPGTYKKFYSDIIANSRDHGNHSSVSDDNETDEENAQPTSNLIPEAEPIALKTSCPRSLLPRQASGHHKSPAQQQGGQKLTSSDQTASVLKSRKRDSDECKERKNNNLVKFYTATTSCCCNYC